MGSWSLPSAGGRNGSYLVGTIPRNVRARHANGGAVIKLAFGSTFGPVGLRSPALPDGAPPLNCSFVEGKGLEPSD